MENQPDIIEEDASTEENKALVDTSSKTTNKNSMNSKSINAGEIASEELITSWKEKGFSRCFNLTLLLIILWII